MDRFFDQEPVDCNINVDASSLKGKSALVTGGANGIGEAYTRALASAGVFVTICDLDHDKGQKLCKELPSNTTFVACDVTKWDSQLEAFKTALWKSPNGGIDIVVANAGISADDDILAFDANQEHPSEPPINITKVNYIGVLYTIRLALHYFRRQYAVDNKRSSSLILQGSLAGYIDLSHALQYDGSKFGLRGIMRCLRHTSLEHGTRVNYIGPWYISTAIIGSEQYRQAIVDSGADFADVQDAGTCLLRIVSDSSVHGRSFAIVPRSVAPTGYMDMVADEYPAGHWLRIMQDRALAPLKWVL